MILSSRRGLPGRRRPLERLENLERLPSPTRKPTATPASA